VKGTRRLGVYGKRAAAGIGARLDRINRTLEKHNEIAQASLDAMPKPENRLMRALKTIVLIAGALAILNSVDIIRAWLTGG